MLPFIASRHGDDLLPALFDDDLLRLPFVLGRNHLNLFGRLLNQDFLRDGLPLGRDWDQALAFLFNQHIFDSPLVAGRRRRDPLACLADLNLLGLCFKLWRHPHPCVTFAWFRRWEVGFCGSGCPLRGAGLVCFRRR